MPVALVQLVTAWAPWRQPSLSAKTGCLANQPPPRLPCCRHDLLCLTRLHLPAFAAQIALMYQLRGLAGVTQILGHFENER